MDQYLFLYPIKEYVDGAIKVYSGSLEREKAGFLNMLVDARYRQQEYHVNWLVFRRRKSDEMPLSEHIQIKSEDSVLTANITFAQGSAGRMRANPEYVLSQLPEHQRLVLGGFHQWDCVDKIAEASYRMGVETSEFHHSANGGQGGILSVLKNHPHATGVFTGGF